ncbi:unnamed protein product [Boreogadus saida]
MQPDLSVSRTYTSPMCFQDSMDKELMADHSLLDPLPDIMVKGISLLVPRGGIAEDTSWEMYMIINQEDSR